MTATCQCGAEVYGATQTAAMTALARHQARCRVARGGRK